MLVTDRMAGAARRMVCASPAYSESAGQPMHPSDLAPHSCVTFRTHAGLNLWRLRQGDEKMEVRTTGAFFSDDGESLVSASCAGLGVALLPEGLVGAELSAGRLVEVLGDFTPQPAATARHALYAPGPYVPPKVGAFVDFLAGRLSRAYSWTGQR